MDNQKSNMAATHQSCPLCGQPATYKIVGRLKAKHFTCPVCTDFCIDAKSERFMRNNSAGDRQKNSAKTQSAAPGSMYFLREPTPEEQTKEPERRVIVFGQLVPLHHL